MRLLKINGVKVDIDDNTAIGITLQSYDIKEPGKRKINITNTFTIPKTSNNLAIIGFPDSPHFNSTTIYDSMYCDYWIDNEMFIDNAKARVQEVSDRISLFVFQKDEVWDLMKTFLWPDFVIELLTWLQTEKSYPSLSSPFIGSLSSFLTTYANNTEGIKLPMYFGNLYNKVYNEIGDSKVFDFSETQLSNSFTSDFTYKLTALDTGSSNNIATVEINGGSISYPFLIEKGDNITIDITKLTSGESATVSFFGENVYLEDTANIWLKYYPAEDSEPSNGGHFCIFVKTIFEFLEHKYGVDFGVSRVALLGNIWDDTYASRMFIPIRDIDIRFNYSGLAVNGFYFDIIPGGQFSPLKDVIDNDGKSLSDFVNSFFQHFNIIKDDIEINGEKVIRLARFDNIETIATVQKFSGKIQGQPKFKPYIDGFNQENIIKFGAIYPEGSDTINSRKIICQNKNLDATQELFTIDAYIPAFIAISGGVVPDLSISESFKTFCFLIDSGNTGTINVNVSEDSDKISTGLVLKKAALYSLANEYQFMDDIIARPKYYEIEKWLTLNDIKSIEFFKQYYIQELNGSFFINKISGFNPQKSNSPTKLELIWISNKVAIDFKELAYYIDGVGNNFTDGLGNKFF